jgi:hypothetical protein
MHVHILQISVANKNPLYICKIICKYETKDSYKYINNIYNRRIFSNKKQDKKKTKLLSKIPANSAFQQQIHFHSKLAN